MGPGKPVLQAWKAMFAGLSLSREMPCREVAGCLRQPPGLQEAVFTGGAGILLGPGDGAGIERHHLPPQEPRGSVTSG